MYPAAMMALMRPESDTTIVLFQLSCCGSVRLSIVEITEGRVFSSQPKNKSAAAQNIQMQNGFM
jgi:hypothetical protein